MGFFSDLKEDLSQAVNELMPEEALDAAMAGSMQEDGGVSDGQLADENMADTMDSLDLSSMLDKLDEPATADWDELEEEVLSPGQLEQIMDDTPAAEPEQTVESALFEEEEVQDILAELPAQTVSPEPEVELTAAEEAEPENTISELSGEEEEKMDAQAQTQEQVQAPVNRVAVDETAVVTEGMTITGDIVSQGSMELIGTVNGNLDIYGKLNITGTIQGDSKAAEIYAEGAKLSLIHI